MYRKKEMDNKKVWTKDEILGLLIKNPVFVERTILKLLERQTSSETSSEHTNTHNGVGFNKPDSKYLTSFGKQLKNKTDYHLSPKQLKVAQRRLPKYWRQILDIANGVTPKTPVKDNSSLSSRTKVPNYNKRKFTKHVHTDGEVTYSPRRTSWTEKEKDQLSTIMADARVRNNQPPLNASEIAYETNATNNLQKEIARKVNGFYKHADKNWISLIWKYNLDQNAYITEASKLAYCMGTDPTSFDCQTANLPTMPKNWTSREFKISEDEDELLAVEYFTTYEFVQENKLKTNKFIVIND